MSKSKNQFGRIECGRCIRWQLNVGAGSVSVLRISGECDMFLTTLSSLAVVPVKEKRSRQTLSTTSLWRYTADIKSLDYSH